MIYVGIDVAKKIDYTAVVLMDDNWNVLSVERLDHDSYKNQVFHLEKYINHSSNPMVIIDNSGVGAGVVEMLLDVINDPERIFAVNITGGSSLRDSEGIYWHVGKRLLMNSLSSAFSRKLLKFKCSDDQKKMMMDELNNFLVLSIGKKWGAIGKKHDDCVIALGFCVLGKLYFKDYYCG